MLLHELLPIGLLNARIEDGYVRVRQHPSLPLVIHNYAEKTAYEKAWDDATRTCRGLIVDTTDGQIVARPWPKFHNYGEHPEGSLDLDAPVEVTDKADGSLGILVTGYGEPFLATRGSFLSEQALHATALYRKQYADRWESRAGLTYLFEIVFPGNRIVLDYGDIDDLLLLGAVDIETGRALGPSEADLPEWPGPRVDTFGYATLREALEAAPRPNAEGHVVRFVDSDPPLLVKIKQDDYVALHRIVTGLNARVVWEATAPPGYPDPGGSRVWGIGLDALCEPLPDEFHQWARDVHRGLDEEMRRAIAFAEDVHLRILDALPDGYGRGDYAREAVQYPPEVRALLFLLLDGRDPCPLVWRNLKPSGDHVPRYFSEDTA